MKNRVTVRRAIGLLRINTDFQPAKGTFVVRHLSILSNTNGHCTKEDVNDYTNPFTIASLMNTCGFPREIDIPNVAKLNAPILTPSFQNFSVNSAVDYTTRADVFVGKEFNLRHPKKKNGQTLFTKF
jgi:hypothetical protein